MERWHLSEIEKLELLGITSIIPSQPTSVSSLMERSKEMHLKVTEPDESTYNDFLEYAGRTDLFWFLRKNKKIRQDQLEGSASSKNIILDLVRRIEEDSYSLSFEDIPENIRMKNVFKPYNYAAFWFLFGKDELI